MPKLLWILLFLAISANGLAERIILPETPEKVYLSNRDVNRIVCTDGSINDVVTSQEKGIAINNNGQNAFIKFLILETAGRREYVTVRTEFYVVCDGNVYTLMVTPKDITGVTLRLGSGISNRIEENIDLVSPMAEEERAVFMSVRALEDNLPESFTVSTSDELDWRPFKDAGGGITHIQLRRTVRAEGTGLMLSEYFIRPDEPRVYDETSFLHRFFGNNIFSVTLDHLELRPNRIGRLFIVSKESAL